MDNRRSKYNCMNFFIISLLWFPRKSGPYSFLSEKISFGSVQADRQNFKKKTANRVFSSKQSKYLFSILEKLICAAFATVDHKLKKSMYRPTNSWNQINQFHIKIFLTKFHFLPFLKWPKINFSTRKKFKLPKMQFSRNFFDQIPFFAISKMAKNQFLNWEKV